jgi:predicted permease
MNLTDVMAGNGRACAGEGLDGRATRARLAIMTVQVAVACVLLVSGLLLVRSFAALLHADRGYDPRGVLSARLSMPPALYPTPERRAALVERVLQQLARAPGVADAAFTSEIPLAPGGSTAAFDLLSPRAGRGVLKVQASPRIVSPRYFSVLRVRIVAGRSLSPQDTGGAEPVVVVNESFARRYLDETPLGRKLPVAGYAPPTGAAIETTVVGVARDVKYVGSTETAQPELYYSSEQMQGRLPVQTVTLLARTTGDPGAAADALQAAVRQADPALVADLVVPFEQRITATIAQPRLYASLLGGFAVAATVIAGVGLFALLSYAVAERSRELAIRAALGATPATILWVVLRQGVTVVSTGLAVGLLASASLSRVLRTHLYGISPHDPFAFVVVPLLLFVVGLLACVLPAARAARLDPLRVLRSG